MNPHLYKLTDKLHPNFPRISFSTNVFDNPGDIFGSIKQLARYFDCVEFEIGEEAERVFWSMTPNERAKSAQDIKQFIVKNDITLTVHAGWWGREYNLCSPIKEERRLSIDRLREAIDFSNMAGAKTVTFHPGYKDDLDNKILLNNLISAIQDVKSIIAAGNALICLENMGEQRPRYPLFSIAEHLAFAEATGCYVTIDVIHLRSVFSNEKMLFDAIEMIAPVTRHLHVADMIGRNHAHKPIGEGTLPLTDVLNRFAHCGYQGVAVIEEFIRQYTKDFYLERAISYKRSLLDLKNAIT